jgi:hypothetical protein
MTSIPSTPTSFDNSAVNDLLHQLQDKDITTDQLGRKRKFFHLTSEQFSILINCFQYSNKTLALCWRNLQSHTIQHLGIRPLFLLQNQN